MERFQRYDVKITGISTDDLDDLKKLAADNSLSFPVLSDHEFNVSEAYDVPIHENDEVYEDHGKHNDPAYFLVNEQGIVTYFHKLTGPFGRPSADELAQAIKYVQKHSKK